MCGFAISPEKLTRHLKKEQNNYTEKGRIQLYEFLDLLTLCDPRSGFIMNERWVRSTDKTCKGLYQMDNIRSLMMTPDEKLERHLNRRFQQIDSWCSPQGTLGIANYLAPGKCQQTENRNGTRLQLYTCMNNSPRVTRTEESWTSVTPVPHLRCYCQTPKPVGPILSEQDLQDTQNAVYELQYQMETLGERSQWEMNWKLDYYLPGYRELSASRPKTVMTEAPQSVTKTHREQNVFERLSVPTTRVASHCHAVACDALQLGIANNRQGIRNKQPLITKRTSKTSARLREQKGKS